MNLQLALAFVLYIIVRTIEQELVNTLRTSEPRDPHTVNQFTVTVALFLSVMCLCAG